MPGQLEKKSESYKIASFDYSIDNPLKSGIDDWLRKDKNRRNLNENELFGSSSFLINRFELLLAILIVMLITLIISPIVYFKPKKDIAILGFIYMILRRVFFSGIYLAILMEGYFFGCLLIFHEFYVLYDTRNLNVVSIVISGAILLLLLVLPIVLIVHYSIYRKKPEAIRDGFFAQFYNGINLEKSFVNGYYMAFQMIKRGLLAACCIFLSEVDFSIRMSIFCAINFIGTLPFFVLRPYK